MKYTLSIKANRQGITLTITLILFLFSLSSKAEWDFSTDYFKIHLNNKGFITSMKNITIKPNREFSPSDKPSPLMCLYDSNKNIYFEPQKADYNKADRTITLSYSNGSMAKITLKPQEMYFKLMLQSLEPRNGIDDIQWGPYHTNITNLFGDVIGVARDTSEIVNYAIGALSLTDNTTGGKSDNVGDISPFQYVIHSPDAKRFPLPSDLNEGQVFPIGGDGISDVAFFSHAEPYYRILYGNTAGIDNRGRISINYHSIDRRKERTILFSLIPFLKTNAPNHIEVQPLPEVDFIGSSIAIWGSPDSIALMTVVKKIVLVEGLPFPTVNGKWIKDPTAYIPDISTSGGKYDSTLVYAKQLGFKGIQLEDLGFFHVDRGNKGYIDGTSFERKPMKFTSGNKSHKEFTDLSNPKGIFVGRHTITTALPEGTKDASQVPSDSLCYQVKRVLSRKISPNDTIIEVNDPLYLDEIGSWEGHGAGLNIIKIGKELIHYNGVSGSVPYRLLNIKRAYWNTKASAHSAGDTIYKLQVSLEGYGYDGLIPNIYLQDEIAKYYADVANINGLYYIDWDGQEWLFNQGHGYYAVKRFHRKLFEQTKKYNMPDLRIMGATLSEGSWHYMSVYNVGGGTNMYDLSSRVWGRPGCSEGKDIRDVCFSNYFPATFGINFGINSSSTVAQYEQIEALSVGVGVTYMLDLNQDVVESCPQKYLIFKAIRNWENAREANAFPRYIKKILANEKRQFHLEQTDSNNWKLYEVSDSGTILLSRLKRAAGY
jgi:hypothetical protein